MITDNNKIEFGSITDRIANNKLLAAAKTALVKSGVNISFIC